MKKLLVLSATLMLFISPLTQAVEFANSDGSKLTSICIAAVESDSAMNAKAKEFGFNEADLKSFTCNGLSLKGFAAKYRNTKSKGVIKVYAFEKTGDTRETELCVAAATSNEAYKQVKKDLFKGAQVSEVYCNGLPLKKFAKRYGNRGFSL